ncbi:MAG: phosphatase PAP2 family protein [Actinomycetota bacterium]|nr:phosphatase PAP2 family protein [Actinomycetota bacterium]
MSEAPVPPHVLPRKRLAAAAAILFALVVVMGLRVHDGNRPLRVDRQATRVVDSPKVSQALAAADLGGGGSKSMFQKAADLGSPYLVLGVAVVSGLVAVARRDLVAAKICVTGPLLAIGLTELVGKPLVDRHLHQTLAFPSGHATDAGVVAALVLVLVFRWAGSRSLALGMPFGVAVPLFVSIAVVGLGRHYATDAVAGVAVGVASVLAVSAMFREPTVVDAVVPASV